MCCGVVGLFRPSLKGARGMRFSTESCESVEAAKDDVAGEDTSRLDERSNVAELGGSAWAADALRGLDAMLGRGEGKAVEICNDGRVCGEAGYVVEADGYDDELRSAGPGEGIVGAGARVRSGIR